MAGPPLTAKLTISRIGKGLYRSRIENVPKGANAGAGVDFEFDPDAPSAKDFMRQLNARTVSGAAVEAFGRTLFETAIDGRVRDKYYELRGAADGQGIRLCLSIHDPDMMNLCWECLHDDNSFLLKRGDTIVRVIDELEGGRSSFAPLRRLLLAAANPDDPEYASFDPTGHLQELKSALDRVPGLTVELLNPASRDGLLDKIKRGGFDALYFVGHGLANANRNEIICEGPERRPEPLPAENLAFAMQRTEMRFVYLNSCSTGKTASSNTFRGAAQRLMLDGKVAAVTAMQVDIRQNSGLAMAKAFFQELARESPEDAMRLCRDAAADAYSFAVPVLYTFTDAPRQEYRNRLFRIFSSNEESRYALLVPSFRMGVPFEDGEPPLPKDERYRFPGESFARADVDAAMSVMQVITGCADLSRIQLFPKREKPADGFTHFFVFGSKSNQLVNAYLRSFSGSFEFDYKSKPGFWILKDLIHKRDYEVTAPNQQDQRAYDQSDDYGIIQKIAGKERGRWYFVFAGLGSRATEGCGRFLQRHVNDPNLPADAFEFLIRFPGDLGPEEGYLVDRTTGK